MNLADRVKEQMQDTGRIIVVSPYSTMLNHKSGHRKPRFKANGSIWVRQHRSWWEVDRAEACGYGTDLYRFYVKKPWEEPK